MMSMEVQDKLGPTLSRMASQMEGEGRERLSQAMGSEVRQTIVSHLQELGVSRHNTADRLGASPTGFIANLAENFDQLSTVEVDEDGVSIRMRHPTISRAFRDITIFPRNAQFLTIPLNAAAYGHRVGEFEHFILVHQGARSEGQDWKDRKVERDPTVPVFLLVESVTQHRDPTLFPTPDEINTAAARGAAREIKTILQEAGRLS